MENQETSTTLTTRSVGIRYGLYMGVFSIAYFLVLNTLGVAIDEGPGSWGRYIVGAAFIFFAQKYFKDNGDGFMSYGQGIGISFWAGLIATAISSVFTYIYVKFIDAGFIQSMMDKARAKMEEGGNMSEDQIDQAMQITSKFMTPEMILILGIVFGIIGTVIIGLIVTIFTQKKSPEAFV